MPQKSDAGTEPIRRDSSPEKMPPLKQKQQQGKPIRYRSGYTLCRKTGTRLWRTGCLQKSRACWCHSTGWSNPKPYQARSAQTIRLEAARVITSYSIHYTKLYDVQGRQSQYFVNMWRSLTKPSARVKRKHFQIHWTMLFFWRAVSRPGIVTYY